METSMEYMKGIDISNNITGAGPGVGLHKLGYRWWYGAPTMGVMTLSIWDGNYPLVNLQKTMENLHF